MASTPVRLTAASDQAEALPGGTASFEVTANNTDPVLTRSFRFEAQSNPPNWTVEFTPSDLTVPAGKTNKSTFVVYVPSDAQPGTVAVLSFLAKDELNQVVSNVLNLTVTVKAPPPPEPTPLPKLSMSIGAASGQAGTDVESMLTLLSGEPARISVSLAITGDGAWTPHFRDGISVYQVDPGVPTPAYVRVRIPTTTAEGAKQNFVITAVTKGTAFQVSWNVTALAASATPPAEEETTPPATDTTPAVATTTPPTAPAPVARLDMSTSVGQLDVGPGTTRDATLLLKNTGNVALALDLRYVPPAADWAVRLDAAKLDLAPGATKTVGLHVTAPEGIPPGGTAAIDFQAIDGALVQHATLKLAIVEADAPPREETTAAALAPAPVGDSNSSIPTTAWVAVGIGTVGAGALALANRPLREKLAWATIGLYTRLAQPDILGHPERDRLYKIIEAQPGVHFHALQRELAWNTGTLTYHLRVLERHQFVVSRRDGPYRRFFKVGTAPRKELFSPDAPQGLRADVLEAIRNRHGISQSDLALALGANKQTVNYHVKTLERQGLIRMERRGRETFLYPHHAGVGPSGPAEAQG